MSLGYQEQNDNKAIILTDTSNYNYTLIPNLVSGDPVVANTLYEIVTAGATNFTLVGCTDNNPGSRFVWSGITGALGAGDELKQVTALVTEITAATLDTTITGVSNVATPASQIDLAAEFGSATPPPIWTDVSQLVYTITSDLLGLGADIELPDGLYALEYNVSYTGTNQNAVYSVTQLFEVTILVYGQVKVAVYDKYRQIPAWCNCQDNDALHKILETDLLGAYLVAIETSAFIAKTEELINMLIVLDDMVKNGSKLYY
jgi:hypothetical protein